MDLSITDSSRAPTLTQGPSTTPIPTFPRRLGFCGPPSEPDDLFQVLRRTAHGFTNPRNFEARGILVT